MKIDKRTLGNPIAEGGEGVIYKYKNQILKVFKPVVDLSEKLAKLEILTNIKQPVSGTIPVLPLDIAYGMSGDFIGYVMRDLKEIDEFSSLTNRRH